ncbi:hypothetical protein [Maribacter sp. 2210JD10-5]|uniref:hypothetical protein n=1 Tax=Maribacter sp. 2210JD10-5 TaxID=3386272 RepID=UPI0039BC3A7B
MNFIKEILPWKKTLIASIIVLILLSIFSFYGLYTNTFYFFKVGNYVFPIVSIVHFVFLYVMWFKIKEDEYSDPPMQKIEYALYVISFIYLYKLVDTVIMLFSFSEYENHAMPVTFLPLGIGILLLYVFLIVLTVLAINYRKQLVGTYQFDEMNQHVDNWN